MGASGSACGKQNTTKALETFVVFSFVPVRLYQLSADDFGDGLVENRDDLVNLRLVDGERRPKHNHIARRAIRAALGVINN